MISDRQCEILRLIEAKGPQSIRYLAEMYALTTQTMRRDINALCDQGLSRRYHGGVEVSVVGRNISINARAALNDEAKLAIASRVAAAIPSGATVFMGIGSTVQCVAATLFDHGELRVITNNIDVAMTLSEAPQIEVHMTGGILRHNDRDAVGGDALSFFGKFYASHAVIGAGALDAANGILDFTYPEAQLTMKLVENARQQYLVADASKWSREAAVRVLPFSAVSHLFTDRLPDTAIARDALDASSISVEICRIEP